MDGFSKKQMAEITGLLENQIKYYTEQGVVVPEVDKGEGRGKSRRYSERNVTQFLVIKSLSSLGMTVSRIREVVNLTDHPVFQKHYHLAREGNWDLVLQVYQTEDGVMKCRIFESLVADIRYSLIDNHEMGKRNEILLVNVSRLDRRNRKTVRPLTEEQIKEKVKGKAVYEEIYTADQE